MQQALATALRTPAPASLFDEEEEPPPPRALCAKVAGFSLHAGPSVRAEDREALEHLCRYGLRGPIAQERLSLRAAGQVVYRLRRPWPHSHLVRYHGVFANRSADRSLLPKPPARTEGEATAAGTGSKGDSAPAAVPALGPAGAADSGPSPSSTPSSRSRLSWARLLKRVFFVDALTCPRCNLAMVVLAFLSDPAVVGRILRHLGMPDVAPPVAPARRCFTPDLFSPHLFSPPQTWDGGDEGGDSPWAEERGMEPHGRVRGRAARPP